MKKHNDGPRILYLDIENLQSLAATFGVWDQNINYQSILSEWMIISVAWKWKGDKKVHALKSKFVKNRKSVFDPVMDDKELLIEFAKVLDQADIIIGHNIDKFDLKKIKSRMIYHGLKPLRKIATIDTLKVARREFAMTFNKLDYLAKYLKVEEKMPIPQGLWIEVLKGNEKALDHIVRYNKQDVITLEQVDDKLAPWASNRINWNIYNDEGNACPNCGGFHLISSGVRKTVAGFYRRFQCKDCGKWCKGKVQEKRETKITIVNE